MKNNSQTTQITSIGNFNKYCLHLSNSALYKNDPDLIFSPKNNQNPIKNRIQADISDTKTLQNSSKLNSEFSEKNSNNFFQKVDAFYESKTENLKKIISFQDSIKNPFLLAEIKHHMEPNAEYPVPACDF